MNHWYYFTFGTDGHPFDGGWIEVVANDQIEAEHFFKKQYPNPRNRELLNCAGIYTEREFKRTSMYIKGNFGEKCHGVFYAGDCKDRVYRLPLRNTDEFYMERIYNPISGAVETWLCHDDYERKVLMTSGKADEMRESSFFDIKKHIPDANELIFPDTVDLRDDEYIAVSA